MVQAKHGVLEASPRVAAMGYLVMLPLSVVSEAHGEVVGGHQWLNHKVIPVGRHLWMPVVQPLLRARPPSCVDGVAQDLSSCSLGISQGW